MIGRRKPYTQIGISRVPCKRCGKPSNQQWQICANDNLWLGCCEKCDIELNRVVLKFFKFKNWRDMIKRYILP